MASPSFDDHKGLCRNIEVWTRKASSTKWAEQPPRLREALSVRPETLMTVLLVQADPTRECHHCRHVLSSTLKLPEFWWMKSCKKIEGYFGCEETYDEDDEVDGYNSWIRFIAKQMRKPEDPKPDGKDYFWEKINIFSRWLPSGQSIVVIFDSQLVSNVNITDVVKASLSGKEATLTPYFLHMCIIEQVVEIQNPAVWSIRTLVRNTETDGRPPNGSKPEPEYPVLHEIARHAIHVSETLDLAIRTVVGVMHHHNTWREELEERFAGRPQSEIKQQKRVWKRIQNRLDCYDHMLRALRYRSASNKERLSNEIQLAYNTVAQWDSGVSVQIGQATQSDSSAMKVVAVLTLAFLPATFVSAIFSTSFFSVDDNNGDWRVSGKFWLYWAFAIPVTIFTVVCWFLGQKYYPPPVIGGPQTTPKARTMSTYIRQLKESPTGKHDMV